MLVSLHAEWNTETEGRPMSQTLDLPPMITGTFSYEFPRDHSQGPQSGYVTIAFGGHDLDTVYLDTGQWKRLESSRYDSGSNTEDRIVEEIVAEWLRERLMMDECSECFVPIRKASMRGHLENHRILDEKLADRG
jgi:hypothetical protein